MTCPVAIDTARYNKEQDMIEAEEARFEQLCEEYEEALQRQEPEAVESYKDFLFHCSFTGKHDCLDWYGLEGKWAEEQAENRMKQDKEAKE